MVTGKKFTLPFYNISLLPFAFSNANGNKNISMHASDILRRYFFIRSNIFLFVIIRGLRLYTRSTISLASMPRQVG